MRPGDDVDELRGERGDAGQSLHEVQRDALRGEQAARVSGHEENRVAFLYTPTILAFDADRRLGIELAKRFEREGYARYDRADRVKDVDAELERLGHKPQAAPKETATESKPRRTARGGDKS